MPLYPAFLAAIFHLFGTDNLRAVVTAQNFIDALSVIGIGVAARSMSERFAAPAALAAAVIPNFLVHASYILTETVFILFFVWGLCALLWALRRNTVRCDRRRISVRPRADDAAGDDSLPRGSCAGTRGGSMAAGKTRGCVGGPRRHSGDLILAFAAPRVIDHYRHYGYASLTAQEGTHLLNWFYGCLAIPRPAPNAAVLSRRCGRFPSSVWLRSARTRTIRSRFCRRKPSCDRKNPVDAAVPDHHIHERRHVPRTDADRLLRILREFRQPLTFFSAMQGTSLTERLSNFVKTNSTNGFMLLWVLAQVALLLSRGVQLAGLVHGLREPAYRGATLILAATIVYFLVLTGPVASPKYRIPIEPPLLILFGMGWVWLRDRCARRDISTRTAAR